MGYFIVFEGLDGSGKSTLIRGLEQELLGRGKSLRLTREPGGTPLAEEIRKLLLRTDGEVPVPATELLLYAASRAQHVASVIQPALARGEWVVCDRFSASSVSFQSFARKVDRRVVDWLNTFAQQGTQPDLNILIDVSVLESERRQARRQGTGQKADRMESEKREFHENVRRGYLAQALEAPDRWLVLDGTLSPEDLRAAIGRSNDRTRMARVSGQRSVSLWKTLEGHQLTMKPLIEAAAESRLAGTMLFAGPSGIGKKRAALTLAQALICERPLDSREESAGCGECGPCLRVGKGQSESLMIVEPDGAGIKIDQARDILQFLNLQKLGLARVIVIDQAHLLGPQAGNALLKAVEEPPLGTYFILVSALPNSILATLRSRSQLVRFKPLGDGSVKKILQDVIVANAQAANAALLAAGKKIAPPPPTPKIDEWVLRAANGSVERALRMLEERADFEALEAASTSYLKASLRAFSRPEISTLREMLKDRTTHGFVSSVIQGAVTDAMKLKSGLQRSAIRFGPESESASIFTELIEPLAPKPSAILDRLAQRSLAFEADLARNVDRGLLLEALAVEIGRS